MPAPTTPHPASSVRVGALIRQARRADQDPTLQLEDELALASHADRLGFAELWWADAGPGASIVSDPMLMASHAAATTHRIRLGVSTAHVLDRHPVEALDRALQLDHLSRGRFALALATAAADASSTDWLGGLVALAREDSRPLPHYRGGLDLRVLAGTPDAAALAGRFGTGLLSAGASTPVGLGQENPMAQAWAHLGAGAARAGLPRSRARWAAIVPIHVAATEVEARRQVRHGIARWAAAELPNVHGDADGAVDALHDEGRGVVGTPAMAVDHLERVLDMAGGLGAVLIEIAGWACVEDTRASLELVAREVVPQLTGAARERLAIGGQRRAEPAGRRTARADGPLLGIPTPSRGVSRIHHPNESPGAQAPAEPARRRGRHSVDPTNE